MDLNQHKSVLKLLDLHFETLRFQKTGSAATGELRINFNREIQKNADGNYMVKLLLDGGVEQIFSFSVSLVGVFQFVPQEGAPEEEELMKTNAVSILFPYLRSQLTLLTTQPNINPVVLPPINVVSLLEDLEKQEQAQKTE
jgi:preprotein translocase subunit SecB